MEHKQKIEIYSLQKEVESLRKQVVDLQNEIYKLLCNPKSMTNKKLSKREELNQSLIYLKNKSFKTVTNRILKHNLVSKF